MQLRVLVRAEPQAEVGCVPIVGAVKQINIGSLNKYILDCTCAGDIPTKLTVLCLDRTTGGLRPTTPTDTPSGTNTSCTTVSKSLVAPTPSSGPVECSSEAGTHAIIHTPANVAAHPYMNVTNWWKLAVLKSPYSMADPVIADRLKRTNCVGTTTCNAPRSDTHDRLTVDSPYCQTVLEHD
jgi:hypothetical protein